MIRLIRDPRRLLFVVLLGVLAGACSPPRPDPAMVARAEAATAEAWRAWNTQQAIATMAGLLQTDPFVDPAVRADPWPCARAVEAAGGMFGSGPKPPCYAEAVLRQRAATVTGVPVFLIGR